MNEISFKVVTSRKVIYGLDRSQRLEKRRMYDPVLIKHGTGIQNSRSEDGGALGAFGRGRRIRSTINSIGTSDHLGKNNSNQFTPSSETRVRGLRRDDSKTNQPVVYVEHSTSIPPFRGSGGPSIYRKNKRQPSEDRPPGLLDSSNIKRTVIYPESVLESVLPPKTDLLFLIDHGRGPRRFGSPDPEVELPEYLESEQFSEYPESEQLSEYPESELESPFFQKNYLLRRRIYPGKDSRRSSLPGSGQLPGDLESEFPEGPETAPYSEYPESELEPPYFQKNGPSRPRKYPGSDLQPSGFHRSERLPEYPESELETASSQGIDQEDFDPPETDLESSVSLEFGVESRSPLPRKMEPKSPFSKDTRTKQASRYQEKAQRPSIIPTNEQRAPHRGSKTPPSVSPNIQKSPMFSKIDHRRVSDYLESKHLIGINPKEETKSDHLNGANDNYDYPLLHALLNRTRSSPQTDHLVPVAYSISSSREMLFSLVQQEFLNHLIEIANQRRNQKLSKYGTLPEMTGIQELGLQSDNASTSLVEDDGTARNIAPSFIIPPKHLDRKRDNLSRVADDDTGKRDFKKWPVGNRFYGMRGKKGATNQAVRNNSPNDRRPRVPHLVTGKMGKTTIVRPVPSVKFRPHLSSPSDVDGKRVKRGRSRRAVVDYPYQEAPVLAPYFHSDEGVPMDTKPDCSF